MLANTPQQQEPLPPPSATVPKVIWLKIGPKKRKVKIPLDKEIKMGRISPAANIFPDIDLTTDDILTKSISRRHARIIKQNGTVLVEDLNSVNGTFINGKRLVPYVPTKIQNGDSLRLGKLLIEVKIGQKG